MRSRTPRSTRRSAAVGHRAARGAAVARSGAAAAGGLIRVARGGARRATLFAPAAATRACTVIRSSAGGPCGREARQRDRGGLARVARRARAGRPRLSSELLLLGGGLETTARTLVWQRRWAAVAAIRLVGAARGAAAVRESRVQYDSGARRSAQRA
jgi:hypothetical protein